MAYVNFSYSNFASSSFFQLRLNLINLVFILITRYDQIIPNLTSANRLLIILSKLTFEFKIIMTWLLK